MKKIAKGNLLFLKEQAEKSNDFFGGYTKNHTFVKRMIVLLADEMRDFTRYADYRDSNADYTAFCASCIKEMLLYDIPEDSINAFILSINAALEETEGGENA